ncbi:hypothetical protein MUN82_08340 [Hymenobacter aerilatus]|uniref:Lipocalin-like domain-containing protein n=1 Tax=Hymenobacter aerilatus TaxID=2932251 RepID=A0A8T9T4S6_9BACT|nr:hypothetical protein [Hymenobacter aerilatus]UOR07096.1 hypothetical protein MUN82_08340 [Hymenobacter aerilatus]
MKLFVTMVGVQVLVMALCCVGCVQAQHPEQNKAVRATLEGEWVITDQSVTPLGIATLCQAIRPGTTVTFSAATLAVHAEGAKQPCAVLSYKTRGHFLTLAQQDMVWVATYELTTKRLIIRSPNLFTPVASGQDTNAAALSTGLGSEIQVTLLRK